MRRYELTDEQWRLIVDLLPPTGGEGGQWRDHRQVLNGIFWILHTGAQWRELPERYGPWKTVKRSFKDSRRDFERQPAIATRTAWHLKFFLLSAWLLQTSYWISLVGLYQLVGGGSK